MELIRGLYNLRDCHKGCVATIGNFDGVHLGHQAVLNQLKVKADALNLPLTVVVFEPQPIEFFAPDKAPPRLLRFRDKLEMFDKFGVDRVMSLPFNQALSEKSADLFVDEILIQGLGVKHLVVGHDFRFGHKRVGDYELLKTRGEQAGFSVEMTQAFEVNGQRVSSTLIRNLLREADFNSVPQYLGRPYTIEGKVVHGDKRGRTIGFPTANILFQRRSICLSGVYAVELLCADSDEWIPGVANVGHRPTVSGTRIQLEVNLFDFDADIYGRRVSVRFVEKLREEQRFDSFDLLKQQIANDAVRAREIFAA